MSTEVWKLNKDLCRCCHAEGTFKDLGVCPNQDEEELFSEMLREYLDINLSPVEGELRAQTYRICETCILRLQDASNFKKQVLVCEERFRDLYIRNLIRAFDSSADAEVKEEPLEADTFADLKEEYSNTDANDDDFDMRFDDEEEKTDLKLNTTKKSRPRGRPRKTNKMGHSRTSVRKSKKTDREPPTVDNMAEDDVERKEDAAEYYCVTNEHKYQCNECLKEYSSQPSVSQHYRFVHLKRRPRERKCPKCDQKYPGYLRAYHLEEAHGIPAPTCGVCGKRFRFPCHVVQHQKKVHMGERTCACKVCNKSFFNNLSLKLHMSTHSSVKKYKCRFCERQFRWENNLKDHVKIHTGDKRYVCAVCAKAFVQKSTLKQHVTRNHPEATV